MARKAWLGAHFGPPRSVRDLMRGFREPFIPDTAGDAGQPHSVARRWLGDETISDVLVEGGEMQVAEKLFPEANIWIEPAGLPSDPISY